MNTGVINISFEKVYVFELVLFVIFRIFMMLVGNKKIVVFYDIRSLIGFWSFRVVIKGWGITIFMW